MTASSSIPNTSSASRSTKRSRKSTSSSLTLRTRRRVTTSTHVSRPPRKSLKTRRKSHKSSSQQINCYAVVIQRMRSSPMPSQHAMRHWKPNEVRTHFVISAMPMRAKRCMTMLWEPIRMHYRWMRIFSEPKRASREREDCRNRLRNEIIIKFSASRNRRRSRRLWKLTERQHRSGELEICDLSFLCKILMITLTHCQRLQASR